MVITMNRFLFYQASQGITGAFHMIIMMFYTTIKQARIFQLYHKLSCNLATCKHHLKSLITDAPAAHYSVYDQTSLSLSHSLSSKYNTKRLEVETIEENLSCEKMKKPFLHNATTIQSRGTELNKELNMCFHSRLPKFQRMLLFFIGTKNILTNILLSTVKYFQNKISHWALFVTSKK